jgi:hypothetical protein
MIMTFVLVPRAKVVNAGHTGVPPSVPEAFVLVDQVLVMAG